MFRKLSEGLFSNLSVFLPRNFFHFRYLTGFAPEFAFELAEPQRKEQQGFTGVHFDIFFIFLTKRMASEAVRT
jgi:hypothetical protein